MIKSFNNVLSMVILLLLSGCGSGGGSEEKIIEEETKEVTFKVEGIYDVDYGQFQGTYAFLDNGDFYGVHYVDAELAGHPRGNLPQDNSFENKTPIAWANFIDYQQVGQQEPNAIFGKTGHTEGGLKVAIRGTFGEFVATTHGQRAWASGSEKSLYFDPALLSDISGDYTGILRTVGIQESITDVNSLTIDPAGNFSVTVNTCTYTGTLTQYADKGVYQAFATASGNECEMTSALAGLLMPSQITAERITLILMLNSSDQEDTAVFLVDQTL
ncbi:hypothetical protein [Aliikangiella sp. IMCC44632]